MICSACGKSDSNGKETGDNLDKLYEQGLKLADTMQELCSNESYIKSVAGGVEELTSKIAELSNGNYENSTAVYQVSVEQSVMEAYLTLMGLDTKNLSDNLKNSIINKSYGSIINILNSKSGVTSLAVSGVITANSTFVCNALQSPTIYIYQYPDSYPVCISFIPGEDGAVSANSSYILLDNLKDADENNFSDTLSSSFTAIGLTPDISKIK